MITRIYLIILLTAFGKMALCQEEQDTARLLNEFRKVMSFNIQPYIYYNSVTKITSIPIIEVGDTLTETSVFYKNRNDLYYSNGHMDMYLQDSLLIQVNRERKTIWISKVNSENMENRNTLPLKKAELEKMFTRKYNIKKVITSENIPRLTFDTKSMNTGTSISLEYDENKYFPILMEFEISMKQPVTGEILTELRNEGTDVTKIVQKIGNEEYFIRTQKMIVAINGIDITGKKSAQMPLWKEKIDYDGVLGEFVGKGEYSTFEVTKLF